MALNGAYFDGIAQMIYLRGGRTLGVLPDSAMGRFIPQQITQLDGDLSWYNDGVGITWKNAHMDLATLRHSRSGWTMTATWHDRRVWWKYAIIDGAYNLVDASGVVIDATKKSIRELAVLCLEAGGESNFDVSILPSGYDILPPVDWFGANPFYELHRIIRPLGYDISLQLDDSVKIVQRGAGKSLPTANLRSPSITVDAAEAPRYVRAQGEETIFQSKLELEAVMLDETGAIRPMVDVLEDWGWPSSFHSPHDLNPDETDEVRLRLAELTALKWFRVKQQAHAETLNPPGWTGPDLTSIYQMAPISRYLADSYEYESGSAKYASPAYVQGIHVPDYEPSSDVPEPNTDVDKIVHEHFELDRDQMIVKFNKPIGRLIDDPAEAAVIGDGWKEPALYLCTSYAVTHPEKFQRERVYLTRNRGQGVGVKPVTLDDVRLIAIAQYVDDGIELNTSEPVLTNETEVHAILNAAMDAVEVDLDTKVSALGVYNGIIPEDTDGAVNQITWMCSGGKGGAGMLTWMYRNSEGDPYSPQQRYRERLIANLASVQDSRTTRRRVRRNREEVT